LRVQTHKQDAKCKTWTVLDTKLWDHLRPHVSKIKRTTKCHGSNKADTVPELVLATIDAFVELVRRTIGHARAQVVAVVVSASNLLFRLVTHVFRLSVELVRR